MADQFSRTVTAGTTGRGNIVLGLMGGVVAAIIGALIWMGIAVGLNMHLGLAAIALGAMVGFAIRIAGHGSSPIFGVMGAVLTLLGCFAGDILAMIYIQASPEHSFLSLLASTDYVQSVSLILSHMSPMTYVIYGIALFEGYKFSIRK